MKIIVYLLSLAYIGIGSYFILFSRETLDSQKKMYRTYPLKHLATIPAVFGLLFLISASATSYPWIFRLIGLIALFKAIMAFANPQQIFDRLIDWYLKKLSVRTIQLYGIIAVIFGTLFSTMAK
jgi:hypothetical protein